MALSPKQECEALLDMILPVTKKLLNEIGEFLPLAWCLLSDGEMMSVSFYDGEEYPGANRVINGLKSGFVDLHANKGLRATALAFDVRVKTEDSEAKKDAVAVALDHISNYSVVVFFPYTKQGNQVLFGEAFAQQGDGGIFRKEN